MIFPELARKAAQTPVTLFVSAAALLAFSFGPLVVLLEIQLHGPGHRGILQILGCHLLHWSEEHLFWDLGMFALLGIICERWIPTSFYATLLGSAVLIPLSVMFSNSTIDNYRGLSGIDTAIYSLLATATVRRCLLEGDRVHSIVFGGLLLLLWCKISFEFYSGQVLFVRGADFVPLPVAHAVGAALGSAIALGAHWRAAKVTRAFCPLLSQARSKTPFFEFQSDVSHSDKG